LPKKIQILIIGHNGNITPEVAKIAYETGAEVAKSGAVLITGGMEGVMEAASLQKLQRLHMKQEPRLQNQEQF